MARRLGPHAPVAAPTSHVPEQALGFSLEGVSCPEPSNGKLNLGEPLSFQISKPQRSLAGNPKTRLLRCVETAMKAATLRSSYLTPGS